MEVTIWMLGPAMAFMLADMLLYVILSANKNIYWLNLFAKIKNDLIQCDSRQVPA
jgi:hypothetical protein